MGKKRRSKKGPARQQYGHSFVTESLVNTILSRGGVPDHLASFGALQTYLRQVLNGDERLQAFFQTLAKALEGGRPLINQSVQAVAENPEKMPLLHWICQYHFLNARLGCNMSDDLVCLVLKAGADTNAILRINQTSALFFAVKYTSLRTVDMLLEAGANIHQRDHFGRTCLYNALEFTKPDVICRLLEYLPATEMVPSHFGSEKILISTVDVLLGFATTSSPPPPWVSLCVPDTDDICEALVLLRQKGARLTEKGSKYSINAIGVSVKFPSHPAILHPRLLQKLAEVLVGTYIPKNCRPKPGETTISEQDPEGMECPICLEVVRKSVTLYCGHSFCRKCILEYGKTGVDCPMCRAQLCREVSTNAGGLAIQNVMGIDNKDIQRRGPKFFTNEQVAAESRAQGIYSYFASYASLRQKLESDMKKGVRFSQEMKPINMEMDNASAVGRGGPSVNLSGEARMRLELASNISVVSGTPPTEFDLCPNGGMVSIEVSINGIPLLARISNRSVYTVLSKSMVDQLGLKRIDKLKSKKFVNMRGKKLRNSTFTCLEPMKICFQGIEVTLRNAIEVSPDPPRFEMTVQLGQDFLLSGLLSVIDVQVGEGGDYYRVVAEDSWFARASGDSWFAPAPKESFRYYTHDGKMADLPLMHFDPFNGREKVNMTISLREHVKFNQCHWCCRGFPEGMLECGGCRKAYYCDERCQKAARKIHKLNCGVE